MEPDSYLYHATTFLKRGRKGNTKTPIAVQCTGISISITCGACSNQFHNFY